MRKSQAPSVLSRKAAAKSQVASLKREAQVVSKRMLTPIIKKVIRSEQEKKYLVSSWNVAVARANGATDAHALLYPTMPSQNDTVSGRTGSQIRICQASIKVTFQPGFAANIVSPYPIRMYVGFFKEGGAALGNITDFLDRDPVSGRIVWNCLRNLERFREFNVVSIKDIVLPGDNYQAASTHGVMETNLKLDVPVRFSGTAVVPLQNTMFIVLVAAAGEVAGSSPSHVDCDVVCRYMFTDA